MQSEAITDKTKKRQIASSTNRQTEIDPKTHATTDSQKNKE